MPLFEISDSGMARHSAASLAELGLRERQDLQRLLRDDIGVLDQNLMVISEEFGNWEDARRRIDLLALDKEGRLVVIELKRTEDGGHMDLQALRYAAMVAPMVFEDVVSAYEKFLARNHPDGDLDARHRLISFLGQDSEEPEISSDVRIVLVSGDFGREITTTVLWLNECTALGRAHRDFLAGYLHWGGFRHHGWTEQSDSANYRGSAVWSEADIVLRLARSLEREFPDQVHAEFNIANWTRADYDKAKDRNQRIDIAVSDTSMLRDGPHAQEHFRNLVHKLFIEVKWMPKGLVGRGVGGPRGAQAGGVRRSRRQPPRAASGARPVHGRRRLHRRRRVPLRPHEAGIRVARLGARPNGEPEGPDPARIRRR